MGEELKNFGFFNIVNNELKLALEKKMATYSV